MSMFKLVALLLGALFILPLVVFLFEGLLIARLPRHNSFRRWWVKHLSDSMSE